MFTFILAAAAASTSPVCAKLEKDFVENERFYARMRSIDAQLLQIDEDSLASTQANEAGVNVEVARLRAVGGWAPYQYDRSARSDVEKSRQALKDTDEKFKVEGDRITALLIANGCTPPDHVTSWDTYPP